MKKILSSSLSLPWLMVLMCLVATSGYVHGQKARLKLADKSYQVFDYLTAAEIYRDILSHEKWSNDTTALRRLSDCERKTGQYAAAEQHLRKLASMPDTRIEDMLSLADILKYNGQYGEALTVYKMVLDKFPGNSIALAYVTHPEYAQEVMRDSAVYTITNARINSASSDFGPGFFEGSKVIFSSSRGEGIGGKRTYNWNNQSYLNVYTANILADSTLDKVELLPTAINSRFHEGTMTYDWTSKTMYITRNNYVSGKRNDSKEGRLNLGIFASHYEGGDDWGPLIPFKFNNPEYSVAHPAFNNERNVIFFTSDMPGGSGGSDIWYCEKKEGVWDTPKNMTAVNTSGDEMFPFFASDSVLYFASNGHPGLGGLDNFMIRLADAQPMVINIGYPANGRHDDFGFICFGNQSAGFFSSNRPGGRGDDDIWEFRLHPPDSISITGKVLDLLTNQGIDKALVKIENPDGSVVTAYTQPDGTYNIIAPWHAQLTVKAEKKDFIPGQTTFELDPRKTTLEKADVTMRKLDYAAQGKVVYAENGKPATGALVRLMNVQRQVLDSAIVGNDGSYMFALNSNQKYVIEASKADYITLSTEVNTANLPQKIHQYEFKLFKPEVGVVVRLDNIYYDYGKSDIRPDAAFELDKLVKILQDNPTMVIELSSHTDSRGSDSYNLTLSDKRANSAAKYIISKGINANRLVAKGYGESKLLNHCDDGVNCSDEEHQYNRRTEFMILDI
ncbi:MAG: OmpA family protein [Flavobacteriales bacterium]|nr:OmpA family protein [Flavobacteriales bacterium]